jgi:hypothetical protein
MSEEQDRAELAELEQGWMQAMQDRDEARLEELVAPGFRFTATTRSTSRTCTG